MSSEDEKSLRSIATETENKQTSSRSRNHYGRKYTLLKMENHQIECELKGMQQRLHKALNPTIMQAVKMLVRAVVKKVRGV